MALASVVYILMDLWPVIESHLAPGPLVEPDIGSRTLWIGNAGLVVSIALGTIAQRLQQSVAD